MELDEDGLVFNPSLEVGGDRGFLALIGSLVTDICNAAKLIPRLAKGRMNYKVSLGLVRPHPFPCHQLLPLTGPECEEEPRGFHSIGFPRTVARISLSTPEIPSFSPERLLLGRPGFHSPDASPPPIRHQMCIPSLTGISLPPVI